MLHATSAKSWYGGAGEAGPGAEKRGVNLTTELATPPPLGFFHSASTFPYDYGKSLPPGTPAADNSARMAEMGSLAGGAGNYDHSTLEVVPTQDYGKVAFNKNDKVAFVPFHEHDKMAVPPQPYDDAVHYHQANVDPQPYDDAAHYHQTNAAGLWRPQTLEQSGSAWDGDAGASGGVGTEKREGIRILGLKRRVFFIVLGIVALLVAIGVGVGVGVGVSTRSTSNAEADTAASSTSQTASTTLTQTPGTATSSVQSATATSASEASTSRSSTSSASQSTPSRQVIGGVNGRCTENWGSDCICLDENVCVDKWNGTSQTGNRPDWPCPNDPIYVKACYVQPCMDALQPSSRCLWREECAELDPGK